MSLPNPRDPEPSVEVLTESGIEGLGRAVTPVYTDPYPPNLPLPDDEYNRRLGQIRLRFLRRQQESQLRAERERLDWLSHRREMRTIRRYRWAGATAGERVFAGLGTLVLLLMGLALGAVAAILLFKGTRFLLLWSLHL